MDGWKPDGPHAWWSQSHLLASLKQTYCTRHHENKQPADWKQAVTQKHTRYHLLAVEKSGLKKTQKKNTQYSEYKRLCFVLLQTCSLVSIVLVSYSCLVTKHSDEWRQSRCSHVGILSINVTGQCVQSLYRSWEKFCSLQKIKYHGRTQSIKDSQHVSWLPECIASLNISKYNM